MCDAIPKSSHFLFQRKVPELQVQNCQWDSPKKATAALEEEMIFGIQAEPELGLMSLVTMMQRSVEPFVEGLGYTREKVESCLTLP